MCGAGNWEGEGRFKMWFNHGGAIEFGQAMLHAGQLGELISIITLVTPCSHCVHTVLTPCLHRVHTVLTPCCQEVVILDFAE